MRKKIALYFVVVLFSSLFLSYCDNGGGESTNSFDEAKDDLIKVACEKMVECKDLIPIKFNSVDDCMTFMNSAQNQNTEGTNNSTKKCVEVDINKLNECIDKFKAFTCDDLTDKEKTEQYNKECSSDIICTKWEGSDNTQ